MTPIKTPSRANPELFLKRASSIASFYGFRPLESIVAGSAAQKGFIACENRTTLAELSHAAGLSGGEKPSFFYFTRLAPRLMPERTAFGKDETGVFHLEVTNLGKSIAEAMLIKTALTILEENGKRNLSVAVNAVGDRDSLARFNRDLQAYYRRRASDIPAHCRNTLSKDPFKLLTCDNDRCQELRGEAPRPMGYLSEVSRTHFRELLEYLEHMGIRYQVDDLLLGHPEEYTKTVFEIRDESPEEVSAKTLLASGGRYDELTRRASGRRDTFGSGMSVYFKRLGKKINAAKCAPGGQRRPKVHFVHVGLEAKLRSLLVLEALRQAHIPVSQTIYDDRMAGQLAASPEGAPYLIIMGQREALEGNVIVRHVVTRSQETVPIARLPLHLKKIL